MGNLTEMLGTVAGWVWNTPLIIAIIGTGIFLTIRLGLPQFFGFRAALRLLWEDKDAEGEISHFEALSAALSATVGLGNIAGVAIAISLGGPGAVFWMWSIGFIGMATKSASCTLAVKYRQTDTEGHVHGGPMYYIRHGMGPAWSGMASLFAVLVAIASFGGGNMFQANQVSAALSSNFGIPSEATGLLLAAGVAAVIIGGIKRIGQVASTIVPFMISIYILGAIGVILANWQDIPSAFALIFTDAFTGQAAAGGAIGTVIMQGVRRGTFSNESGLGSAPIAHAAAKSSSPATEGFVALLEPFIDTIVVCTFTALVIIFTGVYKPLGEVESTQAEQVVLSMSGDYLPVKGTTLYVSGPDGVEYPFAVLGADAQQKTVHGTLPAEAPLAALAGAPVQAGSGVEITTAGFDTVFRGFGTYFVSLAVLLFAFSTMISWSYYGEEGTRFLFGEKAVLPFKLVFVIMIYVGANWGLDAVVNFSDIAYGIMAVPNLVALWVLSRDVRNEQRDYLTQEA